MNAKPKIPRSWKSRNKPIADSVHGVVATRVDESSTKRCVGRARKHLSWCCKTKPGRWKRTKWVAEACFSNVENKKPKSQTFRLSRKAELCPLHFSFVPLTHMLLSSVTALQSSGEKKNLALSLPDLQSKCSPLFQSSFTFTKCWYGFYKSEEIWWWEWGQVLQKQNFPSCNQDRIHLKSSPLG